MDVKDLDFWDDLKREIEKKLEFRCSEYSKNFLQRRVEVRLRANNISSYKEYISLLSGGVEQKKLLKELTIHVTHFFRDIDFYTSFRKEVIPKILALGKHNIKIWSAGSSSGEEACSLMICFYEELGDDLKGLSIKVLGSDYDFDIVERARLGEYEPQQFRELPSELKDKYFSKVGDLYRVCDKIKNHIKYERADIIRDHPRDVDVLVCRNTVIYFEAETKAKLYVEFFDLLNKGGFFVLGKTETINGPARDLFKVFNARERIYRKE
ncbi:MAG: CheR family methyltransferase [Candidatus Woesearchaeota archaeon]